MFVITDTNPTYFSEGINYENPCPGNGPAPEGYSFFGSYCFRDGVGMIEVWAEDAGHGTYIQVIMGSLPASWDYTKLHAEVCLDGDPWLSVGKERLLLIPF